MSAYSAAVLADTPKDYWRLADPGGHLAHDIGSTPSPQWAASAAATLGYSGPISDGGAALALPNPVQYFQTAAPIPTFASWSVEFWCWLSGVYGAAAFFLIGFDGNAVSTMFVQLQANNKLAVNFNGAAALDPNVIPFNAWQHVVATYAAGGNLLLYRNAIQVGSVAAAVVAATTQNFLIGRRAGAGNIALAALSEVALYDHVLAPARITAHFAAADAVASRPVLHTPATYNSGTGGVVPSPANVDAILASVRKTY